jgi:hypothetical protein
MAHAQKPYFVFRRNGRAHLNQRGRQFSRLLAAEVCASAVVILDTPRSEVVWRVLATHSIRQFPLHFPSRASPCTITFQLDSIPWSSFPQTFYRESASYMCTIFNPSGLVWNILGSWEPIWRKFGSRIWFAESLPWIIACGLRSLFVARRLKNKIGERRKKMCCHEVFIYRYASRSDEDTFWEMRR